MPDGPRPSDTRRQPLPRPGPAIARPVIAPLLGALAVATAAAALWSAPRPRLAALAPVPGEAPAIAEAPLAAEATTITVRAEVDLGAPVTGALAALEQVVCAATADGYLHGIAPQGERRFRVSLPGPRPTHSDGGATAVRAGTAVAVGTASGWVALFDAGGVLLASVDLGAPVLAPITEAADGTLWVAAGTFVYALTPASPGSESPSLAPRSLATRFATRVSGPTVAAPVLSPDGHLFVATQGHRLWSLTADGEVRFATDLGRELDARPLWHDGRVFVGGDFGLVAAVGAADGRVLFRRDVDGHVRAPLAVHDGLLWLQTMGPRPALLALDPTSGETRGGHRFAFVDDAESGSRSGVVAHADALWAGGPDDHVYALDRSGRPFAQLATSGDVNGTPVVGRGGMIYVGGQDGVLRMLSLP